MSPSEELPEYLPPGVRIGHYSVLTLLGRGGGGVVYLVQLESARFALKLSLRSHMEDADWQLKAERAMREFDALSRLHHPNIVRVYGVGWHPSRERGAPYLVMEWIEGEPLLEWAERAKPKLRELVKVLARVASALDAMHAAGLCHRDLKSENVLVGRGGEPKLIDLAKPSASNPRGLGRRPSWVPTPRREWYPPPYITAGLAPMHAHPIRTEEEARAARGRWP